MPLTIGRMMWRIFLLAAGMGIIRWLGFYMPWMLWILAGLLWLIGLGFVSCVCVALLARGLFGGSAGREAGGVSSAGIGGWVAAFLIAAMLEQIVDAMRG